MKLCSLRSNLQQRYGLSLEQFEAMRVKQKNQCAICRETFTRTPQMDHDHTSGAVRELLCGHCNRALGQFKEDIKRLQAAIKYLRKHRRRA